MDDTEIRNGHLIEIIQDEDAEFYDDAFEGSMVFAIAHKRYTLPGSVSIESVVDVSNCGNWRDIKAQIKREYPGCEIVDVQMYDHGGITISASPEPHEEWFRDRWDAWQVGIVFTTPEQMRKWRLMSRVTQKTRKECREAMVQMIATIDQYLTGDVWGVRHHEAGAKGLPHIRLQSDLRR